MLSHKKIIVTLCLSATVVFAATASMQTPPDKPDWKNLKVLPKDISKEDLDKVMDNWRDALGVRCGFCHARNEETKKTDYASDAKPEKNAAREMMKMTAKINKKYFKMSAGDKEMMAAISCYTCHHGAAHPETVPPARTRGPGQPGQGMGPGQGAPGMGQGQGMGQQQRTPPPTNPPATTTPPPPAK